MMSSWLHRRWDVWRQGKPDRGSYLPFDRVALRVYWACFWLAPSWWLIDARDWGRDAQAPQREENAIALYAGMWCLLLLVGWGWSPGNGTAAIVVGAIALFRLIEISLAMLGFILDQREPKISRSLITIAVLAFQVALILAILEHSFARGSFLKPDVSGGGAVTASTPLEYLYLAMTYMTTMGNQYIPSSGTARLLQIAAGTSGILLLGIVAARAIGLLGEANRIGVEVQERVADLESTVERLQGQAGANTESIAKERAPT